MDLGLAGVPALCVGASEGIGKASAKALVSGGAKVMISARRQGALEAAAAELAAMIPAEHAGHSGVWAHPADLTRVEDIEALVATTVTTLGGLEVLVISGGGPPVGSTLALDDAAWLAATEKLLLSVIRICRVATPHLGVNQRGRIVIITSVAVKQPIPNLGLSNSLRAAVTGMAKTLSDELGPSGITVNCLAPGRIATERIVELDKAQAWHRGVTPEEEARAQKEKIPLRRYGEPEEVGDVIAFLCSARAAYMTGTTVMVDGGLYRGV